jgi:hypothetical protein
MNRFWGAHRVLAARPIHSCAPPLPNHQPLGVNKAGLLIPPRFSPCSFTLWINHYAGVSGRG